MEESGITPCILIMDKGFYSQKNIGYLANNKFNFICPLKRDSLMLKNENRAMLFEKTGARYFEYMGKIIWYIKIYPTDNGKEINLYLDDELRIREERYFLIRVANKPEKYTIEKFNQKKY
jgi:transposase